MSKSETRYFSSYLKGEVQVPHASSSSQQSAAAPVTLQVLLGLAFGVCDVTRQYVFTAAALSTAMLHMDTYDYLIT